MLGSVSNLFPSKLPHVFGMSSYLYSTVLLFLQLPSGAHALDALTHSSRNLDYLLRRAHYHTLGAIDMDYSSTYFSKSEPTNWEMGTLRHLRGINWPVLFGGGLDDLPSSAISGPRATHTGK